MSSRPSGWRAPVVILLGLLAPGCGVLNRPAILPARHVLAIPGAQYTFSTDFALDPKEPLLADLAALRGRIYSRLALMPSAEAVPLYIFDDQPSYERFMTVRYPDLPSRRAYYIADVDQRGVYTYRGTRLATDLRHECTHALLHTALKDVPLWLDEGLAEYFETADAADGLNPAHVLKLRAALDAGTWTPDLARLEAMARVHQMEPQDYREAWAWVYFLLHGPAPARQALLRYLQDLRVTDRPGPLNSRLQLSSGTSESALISFLRALSVPQAVVVAASSPPGAAPRPRSRLWQLVLERLSAPVP